MKKLNLSLIVLLFSGLLAGCGMKGPLYRESSPAPAVKKTLNNQITDTKDERNVTEKTISETTVNEDSSNNQIITE